MRRARRLNRPRVSGSSGSALLLANDLQAEATLNLDFRSGVLDPRIDFQRTTTGTYYRGPFNQNLLVRSEELNDSSWTKTGLSGGTAPVVTPNDTIAPNGTLTADKVAFNANLVGGRSGLQQSGYATTVGLNYNQSLWIKGTVGGEQVLIRNTASTGYSLITATTNWVRVSFAGGAAAATTSNFVLEVRPGASGCNNIAATVWVWGAQVTEGSSLTPYIPTTTAAITQGQIAAAAPWNLLLRSQEFDVTATWQTAINGTGVAPIRTADNAVAPDGTTTADTITFDTAAGTTSSDFSLIQQTVTGLPVGTNCTASIWMRGTVGGEQIVLRGPEGAAYTLATLTTAWQRVAITAVSAASPVLQFGVRQNVSGHGIINATATVELWGAQVNFGSAPLEYRSTVLAALWLPRFENDPITGNARGLLIEGAATNLQPSSTDFGGANYARTNITIGTPITAPDGTATGGNISATTTATTLFRTGTITISATSVTASVFVKKQSLDTLFLGLYDTGAVAFVVQSVYTFSTNTTTVTSGTGTLTATNVGNGWIRLALTNTGWTSGNGLRMFIHFSGGSATAGDSFYVWGVQVEAQSFASSYIPTTTATVARGAESALMTGTNFSSWYNQAEGTVLVSVQGIPSGTASARFWQADDNSQANRHLTLSAGNSVTTAQALTTVTSVGQGTLNFVPVNGLLPARIAYGYAANNFAGSYNGGTVQTDTVGTIPTVDRLWVGGGTNALANCNTCISRLAYWPTRLPDATLQALTT
jgi:hypothetical protein